MQGSSRAAAVAGRTALRTALESGTDQTSLAEDLFGITAAIDDNAALRRALADPSREGAAKADLVGRLFDGKVSPVAVELLKTLASQRWATERDLADTVESLAVETAIARAEEAGRADQVEDELFRFERIVAGNVGLRDVLTDRRGDVHGKDEVVSRLLQGKASGETIRLVRQAVLAPRGRRFDRVLEAYLAIAATRRKQLAATVTTAVDLDATQRERLVTALATHYGTAVHLNVVLDPAVLGGIRVQIGDDVVDGTILRRLDTAKRHFGA